MINGGYQETPDSWIERREDYDNEPDETDDPEAEKWTEEKLGQLAAAIDRESGESLSQWHDELEKAYQKGQQDAETRHAIIESLRKEK